MGTRYLKQVRGVFSVGRVTFNTAALLAVKPIFDDIGIFLQI